MALLSCPEGFDGIYSAPFGALGIVARHDVLYRVEFLQEGDYSPPASRIASAVFFELDAYFSNSSHVFSVPMSASGTFFQRRVWELMRQIPAGCVRTYGDVATELTSGPRAVGGACGSNPISILIPCHRIVSKTGLGGFNHTRAGVYMTVKKWLLDHEGVKI
ncbi:MAG: methylated-DNA--[protein]-cysteine S-methyltransferase [Proteobacteria bacterium]|nr:methylated-DNA--[protein]-cysteine S-methyltransferase [Pseudomonadota bacterium]MDE3207345.1 methylated-DNA--[protein]-cysteine S-methyltransferase [Pseudomonadota bacterium]